MSTAVNNDPFSFFIKSQGKEIPENIQVYSIKVEKRINQISKAKIVVLDGGPFSQSFEVSSSNTFLPGNKIVIEAGYNSQNEIIFEGIVTNQNIRIDRMKGSVLEIECKDEAVKMLVGRKTKTHSKKTDSQVMESIIKGYSGLKTNVSTTTNQWPELVQYYTTDWDFIVSRAEVNGMVVSTVNSQVSVFQPDQNKKSVLEIEYGDNLLTFNANLNSVNQIGRAQGNSWDYKTQKIVSGSAASNYAGPGNLSTKQLSEVVGLSNYELQTTAALNTAELQTWSKAEIVKSEFAKIQGEVSFQGTGKVNPGNFITLVGVGDRFNGDHFVSGVQHLIEDGTWTTETTIGLSTEWKTQESEVMAPPAAGLLPGAQGLFNGTVKKTDQDPDNQYRILVDVPMFDHKGEGVWARLSNFYATSSAGAFFLPEVGDEVVVGFLNEDPRFPVILGSLYSSSKNKPFKGLAPDKKNTKKAIVSKQGIYVEFDDENKIFTINTPSKNQAIFSDKDKKITIKDQNGNSIVMTSSGIEVKSKKNITIEASQKLTLKGRTGVSIESSGGDVNVKGLNITNKANVKFSANGSAQAELKGGAQTTIKGAMVMIN